MTDNNRKPVEIQQKLQNRIPDILDDQGYHEYAVLLPLIYYKNNLSLLFEVRSQNLKGQPGEICFPGGQVESQDDSPRDTAIRETTEELGISTTSIEILGALDVLWTPFQMKIHPYAAFIKENATLSPDSSEVENVFHVPLEFLLNNPPLKNELHIRLKPAEGFPFHLIQRGQEYPWRRGQYPVYFYRYQDYIIWGITARILNHFLTIIR